MTYIASDSGGYVGDVASIGGWAEFAAWARVSRPGPQTMALLAFGYSLDPASLTRELVAVSASNADIDSVRENLIGMAEKADEILILQS